MENKSKIIDYIIFLKLLTKKLNIYFPNNFYIWWVSYLFPVIDYRLYKNISHGKYYRKLDIQSFISIYNIKYHLFEAKNNIYKLKKNNIFCEIYIEKKELNKEFLIINNYINPIFLVDFIVKIKINFFIVKYFFFIELIDSFIFEIPYLINSSSYYINFFDILNIIKNNENNKNNKNNENNENIKEINFFNNFNKNLFNFFYPIINNDYIYSSSIKKIIYLDLYKKIINR
jgi:hypothetical protein